MSRKRKAGEMMIQPPCKSCLLHASVTSTKQGEQDYIQLDPHWMCHMGIEPEETVWVLAEYPTSILVASVIQGTEGMWQLAGHGSHAKHVSTRTRLSIYGFYSASASTYSIAELEAWEAEVLIQLKDGNRIDVVRISTEMAVQENPQRGEWACEQSI